MTSLRHNSYLDAAREALLDVGWKRATLTDIARRAGVSRMTIYRAWPDMSTLMGDLMTREWAEMTAGIGPIETDEPSPETIAEGVLALIRALRGNELFRRVLDVDPELLLPYLLERRGRSQQAILDVLTGVVGAAQVAGTVVAGDPAALARTIVLTAHGLALSAETMTGDDVDLDTLDATFARLLTKGLRP
ncbi:TetR/AcrR family transcriptional regulator [Nocardioides daejeonensis]|uniref:TetR/AcrR family transcriptional regulator n=1 Tax=Nocardioides daejeonensis TaxID=1046556 RepID=UPI000D74664F|nr:TetR/AcrR family transcriptional regulator [Nocardioides daejeonensis]